MEDIKEVKLEVGFELEDVFTDLFTARVEDMQLRPHHGAGNLDKGEDLYTVDLDAVWAGEILAYETAHQENAEDFSTALALGRLYTLTSISRKGIGVLKKARKLNPDDPRTYKYLAIGHVNAHYQYDLALKALEGYIQRKPQYPFGYNFSGYIHYRQNPHAQGGALSHVQGTTLYSRSSIRDGI